MIGLDQESCTNHQGIKQKQLVLGTIWYPQLHVIRCNQEKIFLSKEKELKLIITYHIIRNNYQVVLQYNNLPSNCGWIDWVLYNNSPCILMYLQDYYTTHSWNMEYSVHIWLLCTVLLKAASSLWKHGYKFFKSQCTPLLVKPNLYILNDQCFFFGLHKLFSLIDNITLDNWELTLLSVEVECPCFSILFHLVHVSISCCLQA